jgi:O-antigen ligase
MRPTTPPPAKMTSPLSHAIGRLELFWPLPLLLIGMINVQQPVLVVAALILALVPWGLRLVTTRRLSRPDYFIGVGWLLLTVFACFSGWLSYNPALSWPAVLALAGATGLFYAVLNSTISHWTLTKLLVTIAAMMAVFFLTQYRYLGYWQETGTLAHIARQAGRVFPDLVFFTPHVNAVATFLAAPLLLNVALIYRVKGFGKFGWIGTVLLIGSALLLTGSRGSWLALLVAFTLWGLLLMKERALRWIAAAGLVASVALSLFFLLGLPPDQRPGFLNSLLETYGSRFSLYINSIYLILDYPFTGIGLGDTFAMVYSKYQLLIDVPFLTYAHNIFLTIGLGLGLPGLVALVWILVSYYSFVVRVLNAKSCAAAANAPFSALRG